jgi:uncharacterized phage-like protein YoqJ
MIIAGTGHRPHRLGGYDDHAYGRLVDLARAALEKHQADQVISGMALGWDLGLPLTVAIPFVGQESRWSADDQARYQRLLGEAVQVQVLGRDTDTTAAFRARNRWMVDNCDVLLALWDGEEQGGTCYTVHYARSRGRPVVHLWGSWIKYR